MSIDKQTIWERVYRTGYDALNPAAMLSGLSDRLASVQVALQTKANTTSPAFAGTPTGPDLADPLVSYGAQLTNQTSHTQTHSAGRLQGTGGSIVYGPSAWSIITTTGSLDLIRGTGVAPGPGAQGVTLSPGTWAIGAQSYVAEIGVGVRRHLVALAVDGGPGIAPQVVANTTALATPDLHINATWVMSLGAPAHIRLSMYSDGGTYRVYPYAMELVRLNGL